MDAFYFKNNLHNQQKFNNNSQKCIMIDSIRLITNSSKNYNIDFLCKTTGLPDENMLLDFNLYGVLYRSIYR